MNLSGTGSCICGKTLNGGGGSFSPEGSTTWRSCDCGMKALFYNVAEDKELVVQVEKKDQKEINAEEEKKLLSLFNLAGIKVLSHWQTKGYSGNPWLLVKTDRGLVEIGWRRRVISMDWKDTGIKCLVEGDVTKDEESCHAWSYEAAIANLRTVFNSK